MSTTTKLAENARFLRNAAPQAFNDFHAAFADYTRQMTEDLIHTTEHVTLAQGRAQQCLKILGVLEEVRKNG